MPIEMIVLHMLFQQCVCFKQDFSRNMFIPSSSNIFRSGLQSIGDSECSNSLPYAVNIERWMKKNAEPSGMVRRSIANDGINYKQRAWSLPPKMIQLSSFMFFAIENIRKSPFCVICVCVCLVPHQPPPSMSTILLMNKILHHQGWFSRYSQGFNHPRWSQVVVNGISEPSAHSSEFINFESKLKCSSGKPQHNLGGGWTNPFEKIVVKLDHFPR